MIQKSAKIVVIDDHGIVRFGYSQLINQEPNMEVVGAAGGEREGLALVKQEHPDLVIIDLSLEEGDGLDLIRAVAKQNDNVKMLVVSAHDESLYAHRVLAAGAAGFLNKKEAPQKLIEGIGALLQGGLYFSEAMSESILRGAMGSSRGKPIHGIESLSNRELQVFELIGNGRNTREIAEKMYLSVKTIERHKENIKQKLGVENASQLAQHATGWVLSECS